MSEPIITVEGLSKKYRIGLKENMNDSLAGMITDMIKSPFRNFKQIRNLTKFGDTDNADDIIWALHDVSFKVNQGEVLGVIGRNGAGKSTLLKILSRITKPSEGEAIINGRVASLLEVGTGFHSELTGRENTFLNGTILGMSKKEIALKFDEIVDFSGVEKFIDTPVKRYSSGMTVRLAFAVAAHLNPEILLIDEVLAVGDAEFQKKCLGKIQDISKGEGRTILFVSHNMEAVRNLCTSAILIADGTITESGDVGRALESYLDLGSESNLHQTWPIANEAPGNEVIRMRSIKITPLNSELTITVDTGISIEFQFYSSKPALNLGFTLYLTNSQGVLLFEAGVVITSNKDSRVGYYTVKSDIPPHLLNNGKYTGRILFGESQRYALCNLEDILSFDVEHTSTGRDNNFSVAPGVIRPLLGWSKEFIGEKAI